MSESPTKKIFISVSSDTYEEGSRVVAVVEKLDREFSRNFRVQSVLWTSEPLIANEHFQTNLKPHETDIVVVILWSRIGTLLPLDEFPGPITGGQVTGIEWEFEDAVASYEKNRKPDLLVYLKTASDMVDLKDKEAVEQKLQQSKGLEDFKKRWLIDPTHNIPKRAFHEFTDTTEFMDKLETHLRKLLIKQSEGEINLDAQWFDGSPFRGLESFELEHAPIFFGRTRARNELKERLTQQKNQGCAFVLVLGSSGCGKSSLVKSGLLYDLKLRGRTYNDALYRHAIFRPADTPDDLLQGLANAMFSPDALPELSDLNFDRSTLVNQLKGTANQVLPIRQALEAAKRNSKERLTDHAEVRLVLIIDQLEELFTINGLTLEEREAFVSILDVLARSELVWVVATMRSDFFDRLEQLPILMRLSTDQACYHLGFPDDTEIKQIIREPARAAGVKFEEDKDRNIDLADRLCEDISKALSALPLLEFTLDQLWLRRSENGELTFSAYDALGGLEGSLGKRAEEEFSALPKEVQDALPQVLRALATIEQGTQAKVTARSALFDALPSSNAATRLVEAFLDPHSRLLVAGDDKTRRVRVSHEALLTRWERARIQLENDRTDLQRRSRLEQAAALWDSAETTKQTDWLLHDGLPLVEAEDLLRRRRNELDSTTIAYIEASVTADRNQKNRRKRLIILTSGGIVILAVIAIIAAVMFYQKKQQADQERQIALSGRLAAQAALLTDQATDDRMVERAAALAVESWRLLHNSEASTVAGKLLPMLPTYRIQHDGTVMSIDLSPDGRLLATGTMAREGQMEKVMARLVQTETGKEQFTIEHGGSVYSVAFSSDGLFLATASADHIARIIDIASHNEICRQVHDDKVYKAIFSPDTRLLATASSDGTARLIEISACRELRRINHGDEVSSIAFSPDGRLLATGSKDKLARLIDTSSGVERARVEHGDAVTYVTFSLDGQFWATASKDKTARLINSATGRELRQINHNDTVRSVAFSPDGLWLATGSDDKTARVTEVSTGREIAKFTHKEGVFGVKFSPDGRFFATASADNTAQLIDTQTWQEVTRIMHGGPVWKIMFSPDSRLLATASSDKVARLVETGAKQETLKIDNDGPVYSIAFDSKGKLLATGSADRSARLVEIATGRERGRIIHDDTVYGVSFSFDGRFLATASKDKTARLIEIATGREMARILHDGEVKSIAFSSDSRWLATGSLDKSVRLIDTATGEETRKINNDDEIFSVAFSFDGKLLAMAGKDGMIKLIDPKTGQITISIKLPAPVSRIAFSPDGRLLATASEDGMARLIETSTGKETAQFEHMGPVLNVAFSPDGRLLATGSKDNTVRLIEIGSNKVIARIKQGGAITSMAFSPDGRFLATGNQDSTSRLIETASGQEVARTDHKNMVFAVAFSPDSRWLATGDWDGHVRLVDADPQHMFDLLCTKAGQNLNQDELQDYLGISGPHSTCKDWRTPLTNVDTP